MININMLYKDKEKFESDLNTSKFNAEDNCLVRIYTSICTKERAEAIAREIKQVLNNSQIIGSTGSSIIFEGKQYDDETLVVIEKFDQAKIAVHTYTFQDKNAKEMANEVVNDIKDETVPLMHVLCGDHYYDIHKFVGEFNQLNSTTKLVGGVAGDILVQNIIGYVFTENGVVEKGIVTAAFYGEDIYTYNQVNIAQTPISTCYQLDECDGSLLLKIENKSGVDWCKEQFGMDGLMEYTDWQLIAENDALIRFPMILEGHNGASRFVKYDESSQKMSLYFSQIERGTLFRIGYTSPIACVQECFDICNNIMRTPIESLFCYTCLFRKLYLGNCAEWELRPFFNYGICGVFMMGELVNINGKNEFLNGSCSFVGVADREIYIKPDFTVFEDLYKIKDDNQKLVSFVLQKQSTAMSRENKKLLQKLLKQQERSKEHLYVDVNTGIPNSLKFSKDNQIYKFDKMCMVQTDTSDLLIAKLGQEGYYELIKKAVKNVSKYIQSMEYKENIYHYILNINTVCITANDGVSEIKFMEIVNALYDKYQFIRPENSEGMLINRFVVVLNQKDLLTSGLTTLQECRNLQTNFLINNNNIVDDLAINNEMEMIRILNWVIEQKKVIPYFQGIYDNEEKIINKYEALMRIQDDKGKIYTPCFFMEIAKKYHMYASLSKMMIEQVFKIFSDRKEMVSINLSAYDINFDEMQDFIICQLEQIGNANNFVFEILEDENLRDMNRLKTFIDKVRKYGVEIAIDDFGSGYSNFIEIVKIEPDYIKVDIGIIKNIDSSLINQRVLENISLLGRQIDAKIIAEGVETEAIQERIEAIDVRFSQGFYFAKPVPYHELKLD